MNTMTVSETADAGFHGGHLHVWLGVLCLLRTVKQVLKDSYNNEKNDVSVKLFAHATFSSVCSGCRGLWDDFRRWLRGDKDLPKLSGYPGCKILFMGTYSWRRNKKNRISESEEKGKNASRKGCDTINVAFVIPKAIHQSQVWQNS